MFGVGILPAPTMLLALENGVCVFVRTSLCVCVCLLESVCTETLDPNVIRLGNDVACLQFKPSANDKCS